MPAGKSNRIVIEIDPEVKQQIYSALQAKGMTLKGWFLDQVQEKLSITSEQNDNHNKPQS